MIAFNKFTKLQPKKKVWKKVAEHSWRGILVIVSAKCSCEVEVTPLLLGSRNTDKWIIQSKKRKPNPKILGTEKEAYASSVHFNEEQKRRS